MLISCESWLDIKPVDRISGRELFQTRAGFTKALNGVYTEMADRAIYGREMSAGMLDVMAQYYRIGSGTNNYFGRLARYDYEDEDYGVKENFDEMWSKAYNLIVNLNIIIEECDKGDVLNYRWYGIIKGESLALRAFLHLDMLRVFGPTHSVDPDKLYIPYVTNTDQSISPLLSSSQMRELLIKDLTEAIDLLKDTDPIIENGVMFSNGTDNSLRWRQYRMNYYAARALLARTYLWFGEKSNAYGAATKLLEDVGTSVFPFVNPAESTQSENPNRVFRSEVMFGLFDNKRTTDLFDIYFSPQLESHNIYHMAYTGSEIWSGRISELFITPNDIRYQSWFGSFTPNVGNAIHYVCKYQGEDSGTNKPQYMYMIPLMRITEMYLIAAECTTSLEEAKGYVRTVRTARSAYDLDIADSDALMKVIEGEYRREFLGEGQMFFTYKRLAKTAIPDGSSTISAQMLQMGPSQYVVPLPASEADERIDNLKTD